MRLCRFVEAGSGEVRFGSVEGARVLDLTSSDQKVFADLHSVYEEARGRGTSIDRVVREARNPREVPFDESRLRIPFTPREIWAAGVTYLRSRDARETETKTKGIYDYVYSSVRPELFLKDTGARCRGPGEEVCVRSDSNWSVPEPELAPVIDRDARVIGYTIGNDVSARDVEGENPLFLPQAKVYRGSSAIGPVVTTAEEIGEPHSLQIGMKIFRAGGVVFEGEVSTSRMKRRIDELISFLKKDNVLSDFTVLMTGTSIVPPDDFSLADGDLVEVEIEKIGVLRNPVRKLS